MAEFVQFKNTVSTQPEKVLEFFLDAAKVSEFQNFLLKKNVKKGRTPRITTSLMVSCITI